MGSATTHAGERHALGYAGEVSPRQAWDALASQPDAILVDVRTPAEWVFSGLPSLASLHKKTLPISWKLYPSYAVNPQFAAALEAVCPNKDAPVYFLCRTGGRSLDAAIAMTAQGYRRCYNVTDGFDGPLDGTRHRGTVAGWKASNLPWEQE
jgi:rhodanese-related sulfurtransferase